MALTNISESFDMRSCLRANASLWIWAKYYLRKSILVKFFIVAVASSSAQIEHHPTKLGKIDWSIDRQQLGGDEGPDVLISELKTNLSPTQVLLIQLFKTNFAALSYHNKELTNGQHDILQLFHELPCHPRGRSLLCRTSTCLWRREHRLYLQDRGVWNPKHAPAVDFSDTTCISG